MEIQARRDGTLLTLVLAGRFDAFGANQIEAELKQHGDSEVLALLFEMTHVTYLSSAGVRVLLSWHKKMTARGGLLALINVQGYCRDVLAMTGFADAFPQFPTLEAATQQGLRLAREKQNLLQWNELETRVTPLGTFRFLPGSSDPSAAEILGDIRDILHATVTCEKIFSKKFFDKEYSIGMGGLGGSLADYINVLGEMITIGGTMVWLPTDGHDTADFLIPQADQGDVMIRTAFNLSIQGRPNELLHVVSADPNGLPVGALYRQLFALARERRPDFRGALGLVIRAQMASVYGSGIKKSAILANTPANGKMVTHESNMAEWFDSDTTPRHRDVTALIVGIGADLTFDLSDYSEDDFNRVFYMHPANIGAKQEQLHNHAIVFNRQPFPEKPVDMDREIRAVIDNGEFLDMRHLLDSSAMTEAFVAIHYIRDFRTDPGGLPADHPDAAHPMPDIIKSQMKYYQ